jgi:hypothetical protein
MPLLFGYATNIVENVQSYVIIGILAICFVSLSSLVYGWISFVRLWITHHLAYVSSQSLLI